jgi:hypothetical protein
LCGQGNGEPDLPKANSQNARRVLSQAELARITEAISFGLTDVDVYNLAMINQDTLLEWNLDPEFSGQIKEAVADRLLKRLKRIERGENSWQGTAWIVERLMPHRCSKPELQISLNTAQESGSGIKIMFSLERGRARPIREKIRRMLDDYQRSRGVEREADAELVREPTNS